MRPARLVTPAVLLLILLTACRSAAPPGGAASAVAAGAPTLDALVWLQTSAEARALALATFAAATRELEAAVADPSRSALGQGEEAAVLPLAVIADLDETLIDNSAFEGRMVLTGGSFDRAVWAEWVEREEAELIPGAVEFARRASELGVTLFYISNRDAEGKAATRRNLERIGLPVPDSPDTLLLRGGRPDWTSDKTSRRAEVARAYRVLLLLGDDLNDFVAGARTGTAERRALVEAHDARWGREWFVLPNPLYGSWESAVTGGEAEPEATRRKLGAIRAF